MHEIARCLEESNRKFKELVDGIAAIHKLEKRYPKTENTGEQLAQSLSILRDSREQLVRVYTAIARGWLTTCHPRHKAMLILNRYRELSEGDTVRTSAYGHSFELVLSADSGPMHETTVVICKDEASLNQVAGQEILNLCERLDLGQQASHALVLNLTRESKLHCDDSASCEARLDLHDCMVISLNEYLRSKYALRVKQRTTLALKLVTSIIQFRGTPWCTTIWTKEAVRFFKGHNARDITSLLDTPFVLRDFPANLQDSEGPVEMDMLELGIMLIEVWEQCAFEEWTIQEGLPASSEYLQRKKYAIRWMKDVTDPMMIWYEDAVSVCLNFDFGNLSRDWEDMKFKQAYCEKVILPLSKTCNAWERKSHGYRHMP
jgi:hypothetical protein